MDPETAPIIEEWLRDALISCLFYALWATCSKRAVVAGLPPMLSRNITQIVVATLTARMMLVAQGGGDGKAKAVTLMDLGKKDLPGVGFAVCAGVVTTVGSLRYNAALKTGDGSSVAAISGSYPALTFVIALLLGFESWNWMKALGVVLALASCACFSMAT